MEIAINTTLAPMPIFWAAAVQSAIVSVAALRSPIKLGRRATSIYSLSGWLVLTNSTSCLVLFTSFKDIRIVAGILFVASFSALNTPISALFSWATFDRPASELTKLTLSTFDNFRRSSIIGFASCSVVPVFRYIERSIFLPTSAAVSLSTFCATTVKRIINKVIVITAVAAIVSQALRVKLLTP